KPTSRSTVSPNGPRYSANAGPRSATPCSVVVTTSSRNEESKNPVSPATGTTARTTAVVTGSASTSSGSVIGPPLSGADLSSAADSSLRLHGDGQLHRHGAAELELLAAADVDLHRPPAHRTPRLQAEEDGSPRGPDERGLTRLDDSPAAEVPDRQYQRRSWTPGGCGHAVETTGAGGAARGALRRERGAVPARHHP